jgi:DNA-binding MarR family transcriptional regulator
MEIKVPKKPRVVIKEQQPDQRTVSVVPIRAISDRTLTAPQYRVLLAFCSYANKGGLTWVGIKTVGQKIGISTNRVAVLTRQLIAKGYIKVLYHGFAGERAHTRQIVYTDRSIEEIVAVTGEKAPYMIEKEQREMQKAIAKQQLRDNQEPKPKRGRGRPRKLGTECKELGTDQIGGTSFDSDSQTDITELLSRLDPTLQLALKQSVPADATLAQYQSALDRMLR